MRDASPSTIFLKDYLPPAFLVDSVDLWFDLREQGTRVRSRLSMRRNPAVAGSPDLWLDGEQLTPVSFRLDGKKLPDSALDIEESGLRIQAPPAQFVLETEVEIAPENNTALEGLYRSGDMFCTQCEAEGFRRITWYPDRPDVMARFTTTIEADSARFPILLSNGNPSGQRDLGNGRHRITWEDPFPKPSYLFALVAGDLASGLRAVRKRPPGSALVILLPPSTALQAQETLLELIEHQQQFPAAIAAAGSQLGDQMLELQSAW